MTRAPHLLPEERIARAKRAYVYRLGSVALSLATCVLLSGIIFLMPSLLSLVENISQERGKASLLLADAPPEVSDTLVSARTEKEVSSVKTLAELPSVTHDLDAFTRLPHEGVSLQSITYRRDAGKPGALIVSGTAADRDALRAYQMTLKGQSFIASALIPLSVYAQEANIPFSVTISLKI